MIEDLRSYITFQNRITHLVANRDGTRCNGFLVIRQFNLGGVLPGIPCLYYEFTFLYLLPLQFLLVAVSQGIFSRPFSQFFSILKRVCKLAGGRLSVYLPLFGRIKLGF